MNEPHLDLRRHGGARIPWNSTESRRYGIRIPRNKFAPANAPSTAALAETRPAIEMVNVSARWDAASLTGTAGVK
jgi:hypothetical protein